MVVMLAGCMKLNVSIEVKNDGTVNTGMEMLADTSAYEGIMTSDQIIEEMKSSLKEQDEYKDLKISDVKRTIDGKEWAGLKVEMPKSVENDLKIEKKKMDGKESFVLTLPASDVEELAGATGSEDISLEEMETYGVEMTLTIIMPNEVKSNIGEVKGNTVTINLLKLGEEKIDEDIVIYSAVGESSSSMLPIIGGIAAVVIVVGVIVVMMKKKKSKNQEETTEQLFGVNNEESVYQQATSNDESVYQQASSAVCPNCGAAIVEGAKFCEKCGYKL